MVYLTEKEEKTSEKFRTKNNENELLKAEIKNILLKIQFYERKAEDKINLENVYFELQKDYDELVREKSMVIQNYENQMFYLKDENREHKNHLLTNTKSVLNSKKDLEEFEKQIYFLNKNKNDLEKKIEEIWKENTKKDKIINEKSLKVENYCEEIEIINLKIIEFNILMEKLIQENQRLNIIANENYKNGKFQDGNYRFLDKIKKGTTGINSDALKFSSTVKNFRNDERFGQSIL